MCVHVSFRKMRFTRLWFSCLDCMTVIFEAVTVCLLFSQRNSVLWSFVWVSVRVCVGVRENTQWDGYTEKDFSCLREAAFV